MSLVSSIRSWGSKIFGGPAKDDVDVAALHAEAERGLSPAQHAELEKLMRG